MLNDFVDVINWPREELIDEVLRSQEYIACNLPRTENYPKMHGIDYFIFVEPLKACTGGDFAAVVNFKQYNLQKKIEKAEKEGRFEYAKRLAKNIDKMGILIADAPGHKVSAGIPITMLYGAFMMAMVNALDYVGEFTPDAIEKMNAIFYNWIKSTFVQDKPYTTMAYYEIDNDGAIRFALLGHPGPMVYLYEFERFMELDGKHKRSSTPLGIIPRNYRADIDHYETGSDDHPVNEIRLEGQGDIMILPSDGLTDHRIGEEYFTKTRLESILKEAKNEKAENIYKAIMEGMRSYSKIEDDVTIAVIKKR